MQLLHCMNPVWGRCERTCRSNQAMSTVTTDEPTRRGRCFTWYGWGAAIRSQEPHQGHRVQSVRHGVILHEQMTRSGKSAARRVRSLFLPAIVISPSHCLGGGEILSNELEHLVEERQHCIP